MSIEMIISLILISCGSITIGTHIEKTKMPIMGLVGLISGIILIASYFKVW